MKDNYSWLDDCLDTALEEYTLEVVDPIAADGVEERTVIRNKAKQTIISQIEIEKLRARIETLKGIEEMSDGQTVNLNSDHDNYILKVYIVKAEIADLTEKLKELENKYIEHWLEIKPLKGK